VSNFADEADSKTLLAFWQWLVANGFQGEPNKQDVQTWLAARAKQREAQYPR
jgi:hypothetical protein